LKQPKLFLLLGDPVEGSLSPVIHNAAFKKLNLDCVYVAVKVPTKHLTDVINGAKALRVSGFNVTIPHKVAVLDLLDELDESAAAVGAVNTVVNKGGKLIGYNTDGRGALKALQSEIGRVLGKRVLLLGAGGAARAIVFALAEAGAEVTIANRTLRKGESLASRIHEKLGRDIPVISLEKRTLKEAISAADILINATSVGMYPHHDKTLVTAEMLHSDLVVNDIVYKPLRTKLLREAEKVGAKTVDGLGMLINQAALSFKIWTGKNPPIKAMRDAAEKALRD
jgi:shikimate dehydrogenase